MRLTRFILGFSVSAFLGLGGCSLNAVDDVDDSEFMEQVGEASQALTTSVMSTNSALSMLSATNGKKIIEVNGVFHAVYTHKTANGSIIRYERSTDGVNWFGYSDVNTLDTDNATSPAIAVTPNGTVGIVYIKNTTSGFGGGSGDVYFRRRNSWGTWDPAIQVTSDGSATGARMPSIVANGTTMHASWVKQPRVRYASFPMTITTPLLTAETVNPLLHNAGESYLPALMVGPGPSNSTAVRLAWLEKRPGTAQNGYQNKAGTLIAERTSAGWLSSTQPPITEDVWGWYSSFTPVTLAAAVNPVTGDSYVLSSYDFDAGSPVTKIWYDNMVNTPTTYQMHTYTNSGAYVGDIVARTDNCVSKFRILFTPSNAGYGTAYYRTASWTAAGLSWLHPSVALPGVARAGGALLSSLPIPNTNQSRFFYGLYEQDNASYELHVPYDDITTPEPCE